MRRAARTAALGLFLVLATGHCGGGPPRTVSLRMAGQPAGASVTIDDNWVGNLAMVTRHGVALPPGRHRITVEAPGYFPWDRLVEVKEGDPTVKFDATLVPIPD